MTILVCERRLLRRGGGRFALSEARRVGAVDERLGALGRQVLGPVDPGVDVVFPHLARHLVEEFDAVAVRVVDVDAVGDAVVDPPVELDPAALQEGELFEPGLPARHGQRDVVDRDRAVAQHPFGGLRQVRAFDEGDVVMRQLAVVVGAVEAHLWRDRPLRPRQ